MRLVVQLPQHDPIIATWIIRIIALMVVGWIFRELYKLFTFFRKLKSIMYVIVNRNGHIYVQKKVNGEIVNEVPMVR